MRNIQLFHKALNGGKIPTEYKNNCHVHEIVDYLKFLSLVSFFWMEKIQEWFALASLSTGYTKKKKHV